MGRKPAPKNLQLSQLRSFCVVAAQRNFTEAARLLGLSVPAVWQQVRALETEIGSVLVRRRGRSVEITPEGKLLLELIQPHVQGLDSLPALFRSRRADLPTQVTVATTYYLVSYHLVLPVRDFVRQHPAVRLHLRAGRGAEAVELLTEEEKMDLGVIAYARESPRSPHLEYEDLFDMPFALLTAHDHPLARKEPLEPGDLIRYPMIQQPDVAFSIAALTRYLQRYGLEDKLEVLLEFPSTETVLRYVALGMGITALYVDPRLAESVSGVRVRPLCDALPPLTVALATRKGAYLSEPAEAFRSLVRRHLKKPDP
jgi:DNA-binding transcriptional LysR family regulator